MKRVRRILLVAGGLAALYVLMNRSRRTQLRTPIERREVPDPEALAADGEDAVALDLDRLSDLKAASYQPLAEYLTAIRIKRGSEESLLFVRKRDVDELASLVGATQEEFLENFRRLGVVVSLN